MNIYTNNRINYSIKFYLITILLIVYLSNITNAALFSYVKRHVKRETLDSLYSNERDDITIEIDPEEQERRLREAQEHCISKIINQSSPLNDQLASDKCDIRWDSILCWPSIQVNRTIQLPCPFYINKFNRKNKAIKHCAINPNTSLPEWTKTNFSLCLTPSEHFTEDLFETSVFEKHMKYINAICISGYTISLLSLTFSIILLLRPKLRCPRNYVHINLFIAFGIRTILVMLVELLRNGTRLFDMNLDLANQTQNQTDDEEMVHIPCRLIISIFRYSGSVYHVSIFSEAIYLMLLLKFPYYSEKKGSKFCILTSWTLPLIWMIPWVFIRIFLENKWCWQTESEWNLVIDVPHTLLLIVNVICTIFIIRVLYSKIKTRNMTKEKIIKYRRLAKSILILIPIFGLHFIFFAWLPYAYHITQNHSLLEIPMFYIESFFNAFQGFVASIACCFIHREVRIECLLYICKILKKTKLLNLFGCIKCLNMDYVNEIRYQTYDKGLKSRVSVVRNNIETINMSPNVNTADNLNGDTSITLDTLATIRESNRQNSVRSMAIQKNIFYKICCCLSSNHKNDFYDNNRRKISTNSASERRSSRFGLRKFRSRSRASSFFTNGSLVNNKASTNYSSKVVFSEENVKLTSNTDQVDDSFDKNNRVKFTLKQNESSIMDTETRKSSINQNSDDVFFDQTNNDDSFCSNNKENHKSLENIFEMDPLDDNPNNNKI